MFQLISQNKNIYVKRSSQSNNIPSFKTRHNFFKDFFFLLATTEWNNLETNIRNLSSCKAAGTDMIYLTRGKSRDGRKKNFGLI